MSQKRSKLAIILRCPCCGHWLWQLCLNRFQQRERETSQQNEIYDLKIQNVDYYILKTLCSHSETQQMSSKHKGKNIHTMKKQHRPMCKFVHKHKHIHYVRIIFFRLFHREYMSFIIHFIIQRPWQPIFKIDTSSLCCNSQ